MHHEISALAANAISTSDSRECDQNDTAAASKYGSNSQHYSISLRKTRKPSQASQKLKTEKLPKKTKYQAHLHLQKIRNKNAIKAFSFRGIAHSKEEVKLLLVRLDSNE